MRLIGYIRVSTAEQSEEGISLEAQEDKIKRYCELHNHRLTEIIGDKVTAKDMKKRKGLKIALKLLENGEADGVVITKLDRLTRSVKDWAYLFENYFNPDKFELHSINDSLNTATASGRLVINIMVSVAQWEREMISERTKEALKHKRNKGEVTTKPPYGYKVFENKFVPDEKEQEMLRYARELRNKYLTIRAIAKKLNEKGYRQRNGKEFSCGVVMKFVK